MTTIPPSIPVPTATVAGGTDITALLTQLPPDLQSAGRGTAISGTVVAVDNQGQVLLQTAAGIVGFQSLVSVSVGQQVTLQVQSTAGGQVQAMVLAAEAKVMGEIASAGGPAQAPDAAPAEAATPAATVAPSVTSGSVIVATVIASALPGPSTSAEPPTAPASAGGAPLLNAAQAPLPLSAVATAGPTPIPLAASGTAALPATPALTSSGPAPSTATAPASAPSGPPASPGAPPASKAVGPSTMPASVPAQAAGPAASPATAAPTPAPSPGAATFPTGVPAGGTPPSTPSPSGPSSPSPATPPTAETALPPRAVSAAIASYAASATAGTSPAASAAPASDNAPPLPAPPPGTLIPLRLVGPLSNLAAAAASASDGQVVATVVARTPAGQMIVDTAIGRLAFAASAADTASVGSQIAFEIAAPALRPAAAPPGGPPSAASRGLAGLTTEWPALKAAITTLTAIDPALARQVVETAMPQFGNPRFVGQILSLLATSVDDVKVLLGQAAADALQKAGHGDILSRLQADLHDMSRLNSSATDWRVFYLPLLDSAEFRQLRVFTRRRKAGTDWRHDSGRFVVDVEFESLGPLQLDGLVQKPRLDLILRSHAELPGALRSGISEVFARTCEAAGLSGKIFFQAVPSFPVSPFDEMSRSPTSGVSV